MNPSQVDVVAFQLLGEKRRRSREEMTNQSEERSEKYTSEWVSEWVGILEFQNRSIEEPGDQHLELTSIFHYKGALLWVGNGSHVSPIIMPE
jgi:hypothetical protein